MAILSSPLLSFQWITSTPLATRTFTVLLVATSAAYYWLQWRQSGEAKPRLQIPYLTLVPSISWMYPWTLLTASFIERTFIELAFSLICLPVSLRYLERLWGAPETFKFIGVVLVISNAITLFISWLGYLASGWEGLIYNGEYHGQMALQTAVLVAFTQIIPEHQVQIFGVLKMRVKRLPMIYVTFSTVMCLLSFSEPFILIQFGWLVSWFYLRFYKRTGGEGGGPVEYGDRSETFAFVHWFPPFLHFPIGLASNATYSLALKFKLVRPHSGTLGDIEGGAYSPLPGGARAEAERRRALALKALDQRLANPATNPGATPPSNLPIRTSQEPRSSPIRQSSVPVPQTQTQPQPQSNQLTKPETVAEADLGVTEQAG